MSVIEVDQLLQEVSPESPCGDDLEYDELFRAMVLAAEPKPEKTMGDSVLEAQEPDWRAVRDKAIELLARTKDLRVGTHLSSALLHTDGLHGFCDGMMLLRGLLDRYWDNVHPQLDPDDDNDPTLRVNTLLALSDADTTVRSVRAAPLVESRTLGRFSLRDHDVAAGKLPPLGDDSPPDMAQMDGAFEEADLEDLQSRAQAIDQSVEHLTAIDSFLTEKLGVGMGPDLSGLQSALEGARQILSDQLGRRGVEGEGEAGEAGEESGVPGQMNSRTDVIRVLDKACDYFNRHEPSSPVPLLLQRAKRLISKNFLEIMQDLAPGGVNEAKTIAGKPED